MKQKNNYGRLLKSPQDIPEIFKVSFARESEHAMAFPYTVYLQKDNWGARITNEKLISVMENKVIVFENAQSGMLVISYTAENIYYINTGALLLHSWIKISGTVKGQVRLSLIEFNTADKMLFKPIIKALRQLSNKIEGAVTEDALNKFEYLRLIDNKFMNYGKDSLMFGENVISVVFQPTIYIKYFRFFKSTVTNSHMHILTDRELIIIREGDVKASRLSKYEDNWTFIPLKSISQITREEGENKAYVVKVFLKDNTQIISNIDAARWEEIDLLIKGVAEFRKNYKRNVSLYS